MGQTKWTKKFKVIVANKYKFSETQSDPGRKYTEAYCPNVRLPDCCLGRDSLECLRAPPCPLCALEQAS